MKYTIDGKFIDNNLNEKIIEHWNADQTIFTNDGNVGIMTNNPQERLDINGNLRTTGDIFLKKRNGNLVIDGIDYDPILRLKTNDDDGWTIRNDVPNKNMLSFGKDDNKNILNINDDGNIGVNNLMPEYNLDVYGSKPGRLVNINNTDTDGSGLTIFSYKTPLEVVGGEDKSKKYFTVRGTGNVGIGVENPDSALEVNTFKNNNIVRFNNTSDKGSGLIIGSDNKPLKIGKKNSLEGEILTVDGNGNVGIGEKDPKKKLVVNGTIQADSYVDKNGTIIGGKQNDLIEVQRICLNNGKTGDQLEKLCLDIDDFRFIRDFKELMQDSKKDKDSWLWFRNN